MTFPTYTLEGGHPFDEEQTVIAGANAAGANAQQWSRALKAQSVVIDPPSGKIPYQPWALAKRQETLAAHTHPTKPEHIDGRARCYLAGVPGTTYGGDSQIVQTPGYVVLLQEFGHAPASSRWTDARISATTSGCGKGIRVATGPATR